MKKKYNIRLSDSEREQCHLASYWSRHRTKEHSVRKRVPLFIPRPDPQFSIIA